MFHEAYHVTIKSFRHVKLLQSFEESADWILLRGVARSIPFILCFKGVVPNTVRRLKSKYLAPPKT